MALIDNIVSYWKLDESSGNAIDAHSNHDGTVNGATQNVSGKINSAYSFDGTNDNVLIASSSDFNFLGNCSFGVWFKTTSTASWHMMMGRKSAGTNWQSIRMGMQTGKLYANVYDTTDRTSKSTATYNDGNWHYLVTTYNRVTGIDIYVDGSEISAYDSHYTSTLGAMNLALEFTIGVIRSQTADSWLGWFNGTLDEVGVWDRCLTSAEIGELYNSGNGFAYPFTTGWAHKINGISPAKINGIAIANIAKVNGV